MSELQNYYDNFANAGVWKDADPELCGCRGHGWFRSEVDTIHKCSIHYAGQQHPEDDTDPTLYAVHCLLWFVGQLKKVEYRPAIEGVDDDPLGDGIPF